MLRALDNKLPKMKNIMGEGDALQPADQSLHLGP